LIAQVRRNSRLAYLKLNDQLNSANANARAMYESLTNTVIDGWGESDLKNFCDKNSINGKPLLDLLVYTDRLTKSSSPGY